MMMTKNENDDTTPRPLGDEQEQDDDDVDENYVRNKNEDITAPETNDDNNDNEDVEANTDVVGTSDTTDFRILSGSPSSSPPPSRRNDGYPQRLFMIWNTDVSNNVKSLIWSMVVYMIFAIGQLVYALRVNSISLQMSSYSLFIDVICFVGAIVGETVYSSTTKPTSRRILQLCITFGNLLILLVVAIYYIVISSQHLEDLLNMKRARNAAIEFGGGGSGSHPPNMPVDPYGRNINGVVTHGLPDIVEHLESLSSQRQTIFNYNGIGYLMYRGIFPLGGNNKQCNEIGPLDTCIGDESPTGAMSMLTFGMIGLILDVGLLLYAFQRSYITSLLQYLSDCCCCSKEDDSDVEDNDNNINTNPLEESSISVKNVTEEMIPSSTTQEEQNKKNRNDGDDDEEKQTIEEEEGVHDNIRQPLLATAEEEEGVAVSAKGASNNDFNTDDIFDSDNNERNENLDDDDDDDQIVDEMSWNTMVALGHVEAHLVRSIAMIGVATYIISTESGWSSAGASDIAGVISSTIIVVGILLACYEWFYDDVVTYYYYGTSSSSMMTTPLLHNDETTRRSIDDDDDEQSVDGCMDLLCCCCDCDCCDFPFPFISWIREWCCTFYGNDNNDTNYVPLPNDEDEEVAAATASDRTSTTTARRRQRRQRQQNNQNDYNDDICDTDADTEPTSNVAEDIDDSTNDDGRDDFDHKQQPKQEFQNLETVVSGDDSSST